MSDVEVDRCELWGIGLHPGHSCEWRVQPDLGVRTLLVVKRTGDQEVVVDLLQRDESGQLVERWLQGESR